jgi:hypothetical protein
LGIDSIGSNDLTAYGTPTADTVDFVEGLASCRYVAENNDRLLILDADLNSGFPLKSDDTKKDITVLFRMKLDSLPVYAGSRRDHFRKNCPNNQSIIIASYNNGSNTVMRLQIGIDNAFNSEFANHLSPLTIDRWYYVAVSYKFSDGAYRIRIYDATAGAILGVDLTGNFINGIVVGSGALYCGYNMDGWQDEVVVFDRVLSTAEIDDIFAFNYSAELSESPSISPSISPSPSPSASHSASVSPSISPSASLSPSASISPSASESPSVSPSVSPSASISPSPSPSPEPNLLTVLLRRITGKDPWLWLVKFILTDGTVYYFARNTESLEYDGHTWEPFWFDVSNRKQSTDGEIPVCTMGIINIRRILMGKLKELNGGIGSEVYLTLYNPKYPQADYSSLTTQFDILDCNYNDNWVEFELGAPSALRERYPADRYFSDICRYRIRNADDSIHVRCGYVPEDITGITFSSPITDGLAGHWPMNDNAADTDVEDISGNSNTGTAQQNTEDMSVAGKINEALSFSSS